ncbi:hypothetical protein OAP12_02130, partial [Candidatus Pelagibacter sp.]|nr:hypothetical protein [Candidatus Pelagibacter sp.]
FQIYFYFQIFIGFVYLIFNFLNFFKDSKKIIFDDISMILIFLLFNLILFTYVALNLKLEWDALAHWLQKAQVFYQNGVYADIKNVSFSYYPHFGTFLWGFFWKNSFLQLEYFGRLILPFLYLSGILFCISNLFKNKSYLLKIIILLLILRLSLDYYLFGGYQDYYLFVELLIFSKIFYDYQKQKHSNFYFILLLLNSVLILWTKQEGFFYNIILSLLFFVFCNKNYKIRLLFIFLIFISIFLQIYLKNIFIGSFHFNEKVFHPNLLEYLNVFHLFDTFVLISKHIIISSFRYPILILVFFVLFFSKVINKDDYFINYSLFYLVFFFGFVYAIYFQTRMDLDFLLPITIDRILLQGSGFMIYPLLLYFDKIINKK